MSELADRLERATAPVFVTHRRADLDSLGAAVGLRAILGVGTVCAPAGVTKPAQRLRRVAGTTVCAGALPEEFDEAVVVDAPSTDRIAPVALDSPLLIDHHEPADLADSAVASLIDTDAGATAELVTRLATTAGWDVPADAALPLLVGLLDDTDFLEHRGPQTAATLPSLFGAVGEQATLLPELLDRSVDRDERIAGATSVLRSSGYRAGDLFVAFSRVGAHEGAAAERLRAAGADLAVVCSTQGGEIRVTARASDRMAERINLGATLLPTLVDEFGGEGGGHADAGSAAVGAKAIDPIVETVLATVGAELGLTFGEVSG